MNDRDVYLKEYAGDHAIVRYATKTAGEGIRYILNHVYGPVYSHFIDNICKQAGRSKMFRVLEYGCGAGMNLIYIFRLLLSKSVYVAAAIGTDFSRPLIEAAEKEKKELIDPDNQNKITFLEAANESLLEDLAKGLSQDKSLLYNSFDLIVGVNTYRYAIRLNKQQECANDIAFLLAPGGYSIMIDMNNRFPFFRTKLRDRTMKPKSQYRLPSLEEYANPFKVANLEIVQSKHFCWIPHSADRMMLIAAKTLTPFLNILVPSFAMRSLVVATKKGREK